VAFPFRVVMGEMKIEIIDVFTFNDDGKVINMKAYWGPDNAV
jgi:steroid delta-isomerase